MAAGSGIGSFAGAGAGLVSIGVVCFSIGFSAAGASSAGFEHPLASAAVTMTNVIKEIALFKVFTNFSVFV